MILDLNNKNLNTFEPLVDYLSNCGFKIYLNYKKIKLIDINYYIYASQTINQDKKDYFNLRDKNDYVSFNKILKRKI